METKLVEVTQRVDFSCCYLVNSADYGYELNCHDYKFEATVCGEADKSTNRVISFERLLRRINDVIPDKKYLYDKNDEDQYNLVKSLKVLGVDCLAFDSSISAESILEEISLLLVEQLNLYDGNVYLKETKLRETASSYVTWKQEVK